MREPRDECPFSDSKKNKNKNKAVQEKTPETCWLGCGADTTRASTPCYRSTPNTR